MKRYRQLQLTLKAYRENGIMPACEIRLNSKQSDLEKAIEKCIVFERNLYSRKLICNPDATNEKKQEWINIVNLNNRKLEIKAQEKKLSKVTVNAVS